MAVDYTYIVSRLRALEASMPEEAWFTRLARTGEEGLLQALREYYPGFEGIDDVADFETGLEADKAALLDLLSSLLGDDRVRLFLRGGYDFDNVMQAWKARRLGSEPVLVPFGTIEQPESIPQLLGAGSHGGLPDHVKALTERLESLGEDEPVRAGARMGEQAKWSFMHDAAPSPQAREYVEYGIDLANIRTFARCKRVPDAADEDGPFWIGGGAVDSGTLGSLFRESEEALYAHLGTTAYRALVREGLAADTPLWRLDAMTRAMYLSLLGESRYRFFDITPVLYHVALRERNETLVRMIVTGVLNRLPADRILERIGVLLAE